MNLSSAAALAERGAVLQSNGDWAGAVAAYRLALAADASCWPVMCNLGAALHKCGDLEGASDTLARALEICPESAEVRLNLGLVQYELGEIDEAETHLRAAIELRPDIAEGHFNLGNLLSCRLRFEDAITAYRRAIELRPDYAEAHWNLAHDLLYQGDWIRGFEEFEWRWRIPEMQRYARAYPQPQWGGEDVAGKTVLLWWEQGFGDTLQFLRYVPLVAARGARVILDVQPELAGLATSVPGASLVTRAGFVLPPFDVHCPVMSLARIFGTLSDKVPGSTPFLSASAEQVVKWRTRLGSSSKLRVGVVWSSDRREYDRTLFLAGVSKSMPLAFLAPLGRIRGVELHSLQVGASAVQARTRPHGLRVRDWSADLQDFSDTAGLIANLDLVITVDTSVAHLAGAMGKPVWVLMKPVQCWRWIGNTERAAWYPTMRIFRQRSPGDWSAPVNDVSSELASKATSHSNLGLLARLRNWL